MAQVGFCKCDDLVKESCVCSVAVDFVCTKDLSCCFCCINTRKNNDGKKLKFKESINYYADKAINFPKTDVFMKKQLELLKLDYQEFEEELNELLQVKYSESMINITNDDTLIDDFEINTLLKISKIDKINLIILSAIKLFLLIDNEHKIYDKEFYKWKNKVILSIENTSISWKDLIKKYHSRTTNKAILHNTQNDLDEVFNEINKLYTK